VYYRTDTPVHSVAVATKKLLLPKGLCIMQLSIDPSNGIPIYEQLVRQIKYAVAEGILLPGQVVPSVRELAKQLAVNPNTVQRAYLQLQNEQVLQSLRGRGVAVCEGAKKQCVVDRQQLLAERLEAVLDEAVRSGLEIDRLRSMFDKALKNAIRNGEKQS
jgi:GntR family transcriptional regulator